MLVAEELDFDVARANQAPFQVDGRVAERARSLRPRGGDRGNEIARIRDRPHPFAAAAGDGLHDQRVANLLRHEHQFAIRDRRCQRLFGTRHDGHTGASGHDTRAVLVAHQRDGPGRRPDDEPGVAHGRREDVFCEKPAWDAASAPDRCAASACRVDPQITFARGSVRRIRLVGVAHVSHPIAFGNATGDTPISRHAQ